MPSLRSLRRGPSFASLASLVAACFLSSSLALAAPAVVTASESEAHTAPFKSTPVTHRFHAGDKVSADEQAKDGWRRVRLPDGKLGFVRDDELRLEGAPAPAVPKPAAPAFPVVAAKVKVFELTARSAPSNAAPVLSTFAEGAALSVSEDESGGFRRVALPDGKIGFVASAGLTLGAPETEGTAPASDAPTASPPVSAPVQPLQPAPASLKPIVYVKDLSHLAELVRADATVFAMADSLATRQNASLGLILGGGAAGLLLMTLAATAAAKEDCSSTFLGCTKSTNFPLFFGGVLLGSISGLVGMVVSPNRREFLDIINAWNARHTDNPFTIDSHVLRSGH